MTRLEAIYSMIAGEKVRHISWDALDYVLIENGDFLNSQGKPSAFLYSDGWMLFTEPKKKVEWYRVSYFMKGNANPVNDRDLYTSMKSFLSDNAKESDFHWIKLELVHTEEG